MTMPIRSTAQLVAIASLYAASTLGFAATLPGENVAQLQDTERKSPDVNPRFLDKLDDTDRAILSEGIGYALPPITDEISQNLEWVNSEPVDWESLRGKVVVVQSWTSASTLGRAAPTRAIRALDRLDDSAYEVVIIHTPEGKSDAMRFLENRDYEAIALIDNTGHLLDELGMYRQPTNLIIDKQGKVRHAGLNQRGLKSVVGELIEENFDADAPKPEARPKEEAPSSADVEWPSHASSPSSAADLQGKRAPDMYVGEWLNGRPNADGKLVIVDFWATWCGPCVRSIPHMNDIAQTFREDLVTVGLSDESAGKVKDFMDNTRMSYAVAVDPSGRMKNAVQVRGIPHVMVISSDWIVRWQGHPASLSKALVGQFVEANRALGGGGSNARYRWTGGQ